MYEDSTYCSVRWQYVRNTELDQTRWVGNIDTGASLTKAQLAVAVHDPLRQVDVGVLVLSIEVLEPCA